MRYTLDLEHMTIQEYKALLKKQNLLPGRRILWKDIDNNFDSIENRGIRTAAQLKKSLATPAKIEAFAHESEIPEEYLVVLKREIGSLEQKPVPLSEFPDMDPYLLKRLGDASIKTSKEYWETKKDVVDELFCLCDLVRINGVGPIAAKAFYEAGYRSVFEVATADASIMLEKVSAVNEAQHYYKGKLGKKDLQFCIDFASLVNKYDI